MANRIKNVRYFYSKYNNIKKREIVFLYLLLLDINIRFILMLSVKPV